MIDKNIRLITESTLYKILKIQEKLKLCLLL